MENIVLVKRAMPGYLYIGVVEEGGVNGIMIDDAAFYTIFRHHPFEFLKEQNQAFAKISLEKVADAGAQ
jgi:hypothetical protein